MKTNALLLTLISFTMIGTALAAQKQRKPASTSPQCGSQEMAVHVAVREAVYENHETTCNTQNVAVDGPAGQLFTTYHVTLSCASSTTYDYDVETHLQGVVGKMVCNTSIHPTGSFEAH